MASAILHMKIYGKYHAFLDHAVHFALAQNYSVIVYIAELQAAGQHP